MSCAICYGEKQMIQTECNHFFCRHCIHEWIKNNPHLLQDWLAFRANFIHEESAELDAAITNNDSEEIVDALIDLCVVAIGTLDALNVDVERAWDEVFRANMAKEVGQKDTRPNSLGLPDLIKPEGWTAPTHNDNIGLLK